MRTMLSYCSNERVPQEDQKLVKRSGGGKMTQAMLWDWSELECFDSGCKCIGCLELAHLEEEE